MRSFGSLHAVGVEGTGSYGTALTRYLISAKVRVVEVNRRDRRERRTTGKPDPLESQDQANSALLGLACRGVTGGLWVA
jgi:predicted dinucleotide-binding enzyme